MLIRRLMFTSLVACSALTAQPCIETVYFAPDDTFPYFLEEQLPPEVQGQHITVVLVEDLPVDQEFQVTLERPVIRQWREDRSFTIVGGEPLRYLGRDNIDYLLVADSRGYLPGEEMTAVLADNQGNVLARQSFVPHPVDIRFKETGGRISIKCSSAGYLTHYQLEGKNLKNIERLLCTSCSAGEKGSFEIPVKDGRFYMMLTPDAEGYMGGNCCLELQVPNGSVARVSLPWGSNSVDRTGTVLPVIKPKVYSSIEAAQKHSWPSKTELAAVPAPQRDAIDVDKLLDPNRPSARDFLGGIEQLQNLAVALPAEYEAVSERGHQDTNVLEGITWGHRADLASLWKAAQFGEEFDMTHPMVGVNLVDCSNQDSTCKSIQQFYDCWAQSLQKECVAEKRVKWGDFDVYAVELTTPDVGFTGMAHIKLDDGICVRLLFSAPPACTPTEPAIQMWNTLLSNTTVK